MIWTFVPGPGGTAFVGLCDDDAEFDRVVMQHEHVLDGQRATVSALSDRSGLLVRFDLEQPWRPPVTKLRFEDHAAAERVAAFGFHVFEGVLCRATLAGPGLVTLDRLFSGNPPPQYHGRSWLAEPSVAAVRVTT